MAIEVDKKLGSTKWHFAVKSKGGIPRKVFQLKARTRYKEGFYRKSPLYAELNYSFAKFGAQT